MTTPDYQSGIFPEEKCFYCNNNNPNKEDYYQKKMYKLYDVSELFIAKSTKYYVKNIEIPRCSHCRKKQDNFFFYIFFPSLITFTILISRWLYNIENGGWNLTGAIIVAFIMSLFCASAIAFILQLLVFKFVCRIPIDDDVEKHPIVAKLKENGWTTSKPYPITSSKTDIPKDVMDPKKLIKEIEKDWGKK